MISDQRLFYYSAAFLCCVAIFAAPIVREADLSALPVWLQPYLTMQVKTQFPLFPWAAFLIGGLLSGAMFINASERSASRINRPRRAMLPRKPKTAG